MRPLRLEMSGFSAFRGVTVIDFAGLDVVALVGATGAGKSSIIDALTFALYGSVARYGEKDVAPVVNQLSNEARVRFDFEVGSQPYSVVRIVRRTKTGATTREARLERGDEMMAGDARAVTVAIEQLLGLTFERFNKTVVLPQGRFAEFLHDKPSQRQELLRELLGLGVYEHVGQLARLRSKDAESQADVLRRHLDRGRDLSASVHESIARRVKDVASARADVALIADDRREMAAERLNARHQLDLSLASAELLRSVSIPDGIGELGAGIRAAATADEASEGAVRTARQARRAADAALAAGPDISACRTLLDRYRRQSELLERSGSALAELAQASAAFDAVRAATASLELQVAQLRTVVADARSIDRLRAQELEAAGDHAGLLGIVALHERRSAALSELDAAVAEATVTAQLAAEAVAERDATKAVLQHLQVLAPADGLVALLLVGEPCPVCEQAVSTLPATRVDDGRLGVATVAASAADAALSRAQEARSAAAGSASAIRRRIDELDAQLAGAPPIGQARQRLERIAELRVAEREASQRHAEAESALLAAESSPVSRRLREQERQLDRRLAAATAGAEHLHRELREVTALLDGADEERTVVENVRSAESLAAQRDRAAAAETQAEANAETTRATLDALRTRGTRARHAFATTRDRLTALGPRAPGDDIADDWVALDGWARSTAASLRSIIDAQSAEHQRLTESEDLLLKAMVDAARPFVDTNAGRGDLTPATLQERLAGAEAAAIAELDRFEDDLRQAAGLRRELESYEAQAQVAGMLGDLLRSTKFERWLLDEAVTDLVDRATVRLHALTGGQYSLISRDGGFRICDHRNADEIRDARSLSGGETFLASLALALALADSATDLAAEGTAPLESIFLDEGFGTLDPDTLDVVAGTIEELGAAGRMVAIVTHIRELAERMPVRFEVHKGPTTSTVTRIEL